MKLSLALNSTRLARFWMVLVTSFKVRSAVALGGSAWEKEFPWGALRGELWF